MTPQHLLNEPEEQLLMFYPARGKAFLGFAGSCLFVVCGLWMALTSHDWWSIGWGIAAIAFFGLCGTLYLSMLVRRSPILVVSEEGIQQRLPLSNVFVTWKEIAAIYSAQRGLTQFFNVYLSPAGRETFPTRHPWHWRISNLVGGGWLAISVSSLYLSLSVPQVIATLQKRYQKQLEQYTIAL